MSRLNRIYTQLNNAQKPKVNLSKKRKVNLDASDKFEEIQNDARFYGEKSDESNDSFNDKLNNIDKSLDDLTNKLVQMHDMWFKLDGLLDKNAETYEDIKDQFEELGGNFLDTRFPREYAETQSIIADEMNNIVERLQEAESSFKDKMQSVDVDYYSDLN